MRGVSFVGYEKAFRGPIESEGLNDDMKAIYDDLAEAYRRSQYISNRLTEYNSDASYQEQQLSARINLLTDTALAASGHYATAGGNLMYWSAYSAEEVTTNSSRQDLITGDVTLPWSRSWTKLPLVSNAYGDYIASDSLHIALDDGTEVYLVQPDDIYDAADNNPETNWVVTYPMNTAPASVTVRLELPGSTNPAVNSIYVAPFPEGGPTVTNVRYLTSDGTWNQVANYTATDRKRRWHFSPVDYNNQVEVTLTPTTLQDSSGHHIRLFGLQDIDISLIEYVSESEFIVRLTSAPATIINNITYVYLEYSISPSPNEGAMDDTDRPVVIRIYEDAALTTRVYSNLIYSHIYEGSLSLATPSNSVWARITLRRTNSTTPVVRSLTVRYN